MNGAMDFNWEIGKSKPGPGGEAQNIKLPGAISESLAQYLEGLPLTLEVSAAIEPHPMMTSGNQYSKGSFHVTYDGYQQFKFENGSLNSDGSMSGAAAPFDHTNATLSLRVIASSTMPEGGASQITPCSKSAIDLSVYVGASAQALGLPPGSTSKRVFDKTFERIQPPGTKLCANL